MEAPEVTPVNDEMDALTREFLKVITKMLCELFPAETSSTYLRKMVGHLEQFYEDVIGELHDKKAKVLEDIDELSKEANDLKRALNMDFEFYSNHNNGLPLSAYKDKIDAELTEMRELYQQRKQHVDECLALQKELCDAMGKSVRQLSMDPLPTELELNEFEVYLVDLKSEKLRRENEIEQMKRKINDLCEEMDVTISNSIQKSFLPTEENINDLRAELKAFQRQKECIQQECEHMLDKLELLWDCLDIPISTRMKFRSISQIYKQSTLDEIEAELKRCKALKQENIKMFIDKLRAQLIVAWDKICKSQSERDKFEIFQSQTYTEDLLKLHEMELDECKRFYEENKEIFEKIAERNEWLEKKKKLEAKQNEPNRYNNRGGQLLREEKERKLMEAKIPKIEKEIRMLVDDYRQRTGLKFLIDGVCIVEMMDKELENIRENKELQKSARKAIATPLRLTPKTPMAVRGQITLKRMASTTNLALAAGNTGKKIHLEVPSNNFTMSNKKINASTARTPRSRTQTQTKRNLMSQLNSPDFAKPIGSYTRPHRTNVISTLRVPMVQYRSNGLANLSANRILKKYRRSSSKRMSRISTTDESLVNYDTFEDRLKISEFTNSSVVEQQENINRMQTNVFENASSIKGRSVLKTPNKNGTFVNGIRSPVLTPTSKKLQTKNIAVMF